MINPKCYPGGYGNLTAYSGNLLISKQIAVGLCLITCFHDSITDDVTQFIKTLFPSTMINVESLKYWEILEPFLPSLLHVWTACLYELARWLMTSNHIDINIVSWISKCECNEVVCIC